MTPYTLIEARIRAVMYQGNMHPCLRDEGSTAGGFFASGALSGTDLDALGDIAENLADIPAEAKRKWDMAVEYGRQKPLTWNESDYQMPVRKGKAFENWDDEVGVT